MTGKRCHICGNEVRENYYLDKRGYTCYTCSMTEKRFTSDVDVFSLRKIICDNKTDREYFNEIEEYDNDIEKIILVLNEQHEENKELRLLVDTLKEQNMKFKLRLKDLGVEYL